MNKKLTTKALVLGAMVCVLANNASASNARQAVLGNQPVVRTVNSLASEQVQTNSVNGSLWYDDDMNVFYNPAQLLNYKNMITIDKGAEGGFFKSINDNFAYGLYMNRGGNNTYDGTGLLTSTGAGFANEAGLIAPGVRQNADYFPAALSANGTTKRPIDLLIAGDTGIKWGLGITYAYNKNESTATGTDTDAGVYGRYWHFTLGAEVMGFEPFIGATVSSQIENKTLTSANAAIQKLSEMNAGVRYKYESWTPYVVYKSFSQTGSNTTEAIKTKIKMTGLGVGHTTKVADGVHVLKNVGLWMNNVYDSSASLVAIGDSTGTGGSNGPTTAPQGQAFKETVVPMNVAIEADAASWLTLRAGANYDLVNQRTFRRTATTGAAASDRKISQNGTRTFRVGSTLKFGKLSLDSAFGTAAGLDSTSVGVDANMFALFNVNYKW